MSDMQHGTQKFRNNRRRLNVRGGQTNAVQVNNAREDQRNTGQKIRLRRNVNKQAVIEKNLSHMEQQAQKKRVAQALYYSTNTGQSPLTRTSSSFVERPPVHNRLGSAVRLRRNTNLTNQPPKRGNLQARLQRMRPQQRQTNFRPSLTGMRVFTAQNRLTRIRQANTNMSQRGFIQRVNVQRGFQRGMRRGGIQRGGTQILSTPNAGQKIRLRRNPVNRLGGINYTVQVANNGVFSNVKKHHVSDYLDSSLQEEIRMIQQKSMIRDTIPPLPIHPSGTGFTGTSLHARFSSL